MTERKLEQPTAPESPETDALLMQHLSPRSKWLGLGRESYREAAVRQVGALIEHARSLERRLSLAQTEIKGHMRIAKEIRIEALKEAAEACELERVAAEETGDEGDIAYNLACQHCATAIRALLLKPRA